MYVNVLPVTEVSRTVVYCSWEVHIVQVQALYSVQGFVLLVLCAYFCLPPPHIYIITAATVVSVSVCDMWYTVYMVV